MSGAIAYQIRYKVAGTSQFTVVNSTSNHKTITGLTPSTDYVWKVKAICSKSPAISSDNSAQEKFTTLPLRLGEEKEIIIADVYPNPAEDELTISMVIQYSEVTIQVYDLQGKIIHLPITIESSQTRINTSGLPGGLYSIQVTNQTGAREVRTFVKQ